MGSSELWGECECECVALASGSNPGLQGYVNTMLRPHSSACVT
jgi:hypothetical protein